MKKYILKRLALAVLVLLGLTTITFFLARVIPGDPAALWVGQRAKAEQMEAARKELGLDKPLPVQFSGLHEKPRHGRPGHIPAYPPQGER